MNKAKKKHNKRELIESEKYTKHANAKPYVRKKSIEVHLSEQADAEYYDKEEILNTLLGDWDAL